MHLSRPHLESIVSKQALIVIDLQNDYFPEGKFPLWNADATLAKTETAIAQAQAKDIPVVLIQHIADKAKGVAPFFNEATPGVEIHPRILAAAPDAPVVVKSFADAFHRTTLEETLMRLDAEELLICGMMTQNCVTHTSISKAAEKYSVKILADCCTTVTEMIHLIALSGVSTRVDLVQTKDVL
jgi:nicotinamidase-related amidase